VTRPEHFDVVVVGAGAAGCVVAARLAEAPERSVLLLEAGPDCRGAAPAGFDDGWQLPRGFDWGYTSEPGESGEPQAVRRIKLVGGTSWLTRFTPRGAPADYDRWAALGNPGWDFESVLPHLMGLENDVDFGDRPYHGDSGPIPVDRYREVPYTDAAAAVFDAMQQVGLPLVEDHNEPSAVGVGRMPMNSREGRRVTTADAYLAATPPNLTVRGDAEVATVIFDGARASGVALLDGTTVHADWVVLSAGTYGSALILMRSGLGPAEHLSSLGIPVLADLPGVGSNLADHCGVEIDCGYRGPTREEPLLHLIASFHSSITPATEAPDLLLWGADPVRPEGEDPWLGIETLLMRPQSRGTVRLRSADPAERPLIQLPGLRESADLARLLQAYERALEVANHPEVRRVCEAPVAGAPEGRAATETWIRQTLYSYPHVAGTCAMGPRPEDGAVVDAGGAVHGADRLSVVDASVMPDIPSGFTHIPTIMIAERLSQAIAAAL
jgi:choline dehydrogenase